MTLVLEIEHLMGVAFAAIGPDSDVPDWPPQPDRVFSALVATWATRGEAARGDLDLEEHALKWLERQAAPRILASDADPRTAHITYVPPNDYESPDGDLGKVRWYRDFLSRNIAPPKEGGHRKPWLEAWSVMPDQRKRSGLKERSFPAARPRDPMVRLFWPKLKPDRETLQALEKLAADTSYVGHSASLTRCRFLVTDQSDVPAGSQHAKRSIYPGRFTELQDKYQLFVTSGGRHGRPLPGEPVRMPARTEERRHQSVFGGDWLILEDVGEETGTSGGDGLPRMPDIRACAIVAKAIRDTLLDGYARAGQDGSIPMQVSGHDEDGGPARAPHMAIVPLAFAGFPHADGRVLGFGLVPPRPDADGKTILDDPAFRRALRKVASIEAMKDGQERRRILRVSPRKSAGHPPFLIALSPTFEPPARRSLDPKPYTTPARTFATVTPIVLDRHLKENGEAREEEIVERIVAACRHVGLPEPETIATQRGTRPAVFPDKHSAIEGAPGTRPSGKSPAWMRWRLPASLATRALTHAVIRFAEPVEGPVILGAGRFVGMGLCRPIDRLEGGQ